MQQSRDVRPAVVTLDPPPARHHHGSDPASSLLPPAPATRQPGEESSRASAGPSPVRPGGGGEEEDGGGDVDSPQDLSRKDGVGAPAAERRYECRHCHLATRDLAVFSAHVDAAHPGVLANPLYVCRACRFRSSLRSEFDAHNRRRHRSLGRMKLRITKMPDRTVLEQSPVGRALDVGGDDGDDCKRRSAETSLATPAVVRPSDDAAGGAVPNPSGLSARRSPRPSFEKPNGAEPQRRLTDVAAENGAGARELAAKTAAVVPRSQRRHQRQQEDRAGGLQIFNPALPHIVLNASKIAQGDPAFARAVFDGAPTAKQAHGGGAAEDDATTATAGSEPAPALAAARNGHRRERPTTADDDADEAAPALDDAGRMDGDQHLLAAFARFPYPSSGDIAWLASVTPFAEWRLRGWFAARRTARAISWSPGEIEERRRRLVASTMATLLMSGPGAETHDGAGAQPDVASKQPATGEGRPPSALGADQAAAAAPVELPAASPDVSAARAHESSSSPLALAASASSAASSVRSPSPAMAPSASSSSSSSSPPPDHAPPSVSPDAPAPPGAPSSPCRGARGKHKKSKEQLARLKRSFARDRRPDEGELRRLVGATGLGRSEVKKWFSDSRYHWRDGAGGDGRAGPRRPSASRFFHRNLPTMCPLEFAGRMSIVDSLNWAAEARHRRPGEEGGVVVGQGGGGEETAAGAAAVTAVAAARAAAGEEHEDEEMTTTTVATDGCESAGKFDVERPSANERNGDEEEPAADVAGVAARRPPPLATLAGSPDGRRGDRPEPGGAGGRAAEEATNADEEEEARGFYGDEPARDGARPRPTALDGARPAGGPHPEPRGRLIAKIKIPRNGGNYEHVKPSPSGEIRAALRGGCSASAPPALAAHSAYSDHTAHTVRTTHTAHTTHSAPSALTAHSAHAIHTAYSTHTTHSAYTAHSAHSALTAHATHTAYSELSAHTAQFKYSHFTHPAHPAHSTHPAHSPHTVHYAHTTHTSAHEAYASHVSAHGTHGAHGTLAASATPTDRLLDREFTPPPPLAPSPPPPPEPRFGPEHHQGPGCPGLLEAPGRRTAVVKPSVQRPKKTKEQLSVLKAVFQQTQWPTPEEYAALVARTGLPRSDIVRWFGDTRFAYKHGQLRWIRGQRSEPADGRAAAGAAARTRPARGRGSRRHDGSPAAALGARLAGEFLRSPDGHGGGGGGGGCYDSAERGKAALYRFQVDARASYAEPALAEEEEAGGCAGRRGEGNGAGERR
ncbi:uncharacterized protein LOC144951707 [Lampetra fluviatilis]